MAWGGANTLNHKGQRITKTDPTKTYGAKLSDQVNWTTPTCHMAKEGAYPAEFTRNTISLTAQANWPTPDVAQAQKVSNRPNYGQLGLANHPDVHGTTVQRNPMKKDRPGQPGQDQGQYEWEEPRVIWKTEPKLGGTVDGSTHRVNRLRLLGNGVVPQTAAKAWVIMSERFN